MEVGGDSEDSGDSLAKVNGVKCVYFIQHGENGPIKIGFTSELPHRLSAIRSVNLAARLLAVIPFEGRKKERELHQRFQAHRQSGEWFAPHEDLLALIATLPTVLPPEAPLAPELKPAMLAPSPPPPPPRKRMVPGKGQKWRSQAEKEAWSEKCRQAQRRGAERKEAIRNQPVRRERVEPALLAYLAELKTDEHPAIAAFLRSIGLRDAINAWKQCEIILIERGWEIYTENAGRYSRTFWRPVGSKMSNVDDLYKAFRAGWERSGIDST